ncbi:hypothetical protein NDU88_003132 [Pleurodeles waltl]|uniref:Uncharacterized protein n=1 Tax=Pleurodeles waltl TaxID=8319 RepID=A0AAV7LG84_PLEWA|nr:hypothetical protein NDU88_003132 [Pleurodeles waltl]
MLARRGKRGGTRSALWTGRQTGLTEVGAAHTWHRGGPVGLPRESILRPGLRRPCGGATEPGAVYLGRGACLGLKTTSAYLRGTRGASPAAGRRGLSPWAPSGGGRRTRRGLGRERRPAVDGCPSPPC